ncbi:hypothetical protein BDV23DRAFT_147728 [Aspergillus alliaceus]|uniref:Uncharacterized protein n=1 Tax=Petromyces alliaceus TaxID=209559 RepID=A0A5N7CKH4_PETAA|nr:hypothetical protein BDV23DRAFT_147728 [Aspergillus alliaceus]
MHHWESMATASGMIYEGVLSMSGPDMMFHDIFWLLCFTFIPVLQLEQWACYVRISVSLAWSPFSWSASFDSY